jgi:hypothetical protein
MPTKSSESAANEQPESLSNDSMISGPLIPWLCFRLSRATIIHSRRTEQANWHVISRLLPEYRRELLEQGIE